MMTTEYQEANKFDFGRALALLKEGKAVSRGMFSKDTCVKMQVPDENSKMTKPYLYIEKVYGNEQVGGKERTPAVLSTESLLAVDWFEIK